MKPIFRAKQPNRRYTNPHTSLHAPVPMPGSGRRRLNFSALVVGTCALIWLLLRSGTKPTRFSYPCQQSAFGTATAAFGAPLVAAIIAGRAGLLKFMRTGCGKVAGGLLTTLALVMFATASYDTQPVAAIVVPPDNLHPDVYLINNARGPRPGRFGGVDDLVTLMGVTGFKWHRSESADLTAGPDGLIGSDDVVIVKINAQWPQRGGTNTDVLRGVLRRIVEHPDGFAGEVIVADNTQSYSSMNLTQNNAEDRSQSNQSVVDDFANEGWEVSALQWDAFRHLAVGEYSAGDLGNGYVLSPARDPETGVLVSYPKFQSAAGNYISYKHGIWNPVLSQYDPGRLVVINIPVLKTHFKYAVTAAVKNHMGVVTTRLNTNAHNAVEFGGLGSVLAEVRTPDLNILDCIWILAHPGSGPAAAYTDATRSDQLVASTDAVALDVWAVKHILMPQIITNGYDPTDYGDMQDPDNPEGMFRKYLDKSMSEMLLGGIDTTNDPTAVDLHVWAGDLDRDGDLDLNDFPDFLTCLAGPDAPMDPLCEPYDFDQNGRLDLEDVSRFQNHFAGP